MPTVTAPANQNVTAGATVTITFSETGAVSRSTTFDYVTGSTPTIANGTAVTSTFTAGPAGSLYVIRRTVVDASSVSAFATTEVRVPLLLTTTTVQPLTITPTGTWAAVGGVNPAVLADGSDSTFYESPILTTTEAVHRHRYQPTNNRADGTITLRVAVTDTGTSHVNVRLYVGAGSSTVIDSWAINATVDPTDYLHVLSPTVITAITNAASGDGWRQLYVEVGATT